MSEVGLWWGGPLEMPQRRRAESQLSQLSVAPPPLPPQEQQQRQQQQRGLEPEREGPPPEEEPLSWQEPRRGAHCVSSTACLIGARKLFINNA